MTYYLPNLQSAVIYYTEFAERTATMAARCPRGSVARAEYIRAANHWTAVARTLEAAL